MLERAQGYYDTRAIWQQAIQDRVACKIPPEGLRVFLAFVFGLWLFFVAARGEGAGGRGSRISCSRNSNMQKFLGIYSILCVWLTRCEHNLADASRKSQRCFAALYVRFRSRCTWQHSCFHKKTCSQSTLQELLRMRADSAP